METIIRSGRFYFWPIIIANTVTMTNGFGGNLMKSVLLSLVISLLASFGFLLNDLWDREVDRVNNAGHFENSSYRVLTQGKLLAGFLLFMGILVALRIGFVEFIFACALAASLTAYSLLLRKLLFVPTILAAILATSPLWSPLALWSRVDHTKIAFIAALLLIVAGREILMDTRDHDGDRAGRRRTVPTVFGKKPAKTLAIVLSLWGTASLLWMVAVLVSNHSSKVGGFVGLAVTLTVAYLVLQPAIQSPLQKPDERGSLDRYIRLSRFAMALIPIVNLILWHT